MAAGRRQENRRPTPAPRRWCARSLIVEVEDATWQRQLFSLKPFIVRNLAKILGPGMIEDTEFRIVPRRRDPQRAVQAVPGGLFADEADAIADPVMRGIYRAARNKALA